MAERMIRFYELLDEHGRQFPDLDVPNLLDLVDAIPASEAYVRLARMELLGSTYRPPRATGRAGQAAMIVLDRITREVRLRIENNRSFRPLQLGQGDTIAEPTHYGVFPSNVVGIMKAGGNAPGPASLRDFLNMVPLVNEPISIHPLVDVNAVRALGDVGRLTRLDLELDADATAAVLGQTRFLGDVFDIFHQRLPGVTAEVILKIDRRSREASEIAFEELRGVVASQAIGSMQRAKMGYRRLEDGKADSFDFISESIAHAVEVDIDEDTQGATDRSASEGLAQAYDYLYEDIRSSLKGSQTDHD